MKDNYGYDANSIHIAKGAERHRSDPARYLGAKDIEGIFNQFIEIYDNSVDEMLRWYSMLHTPEYYGNQLNGKKLPPLELYIEVKDDWSIIVDDMGRGVPCDYPTDEEGNILPDSEPAIFPIYENDSAGGKSIHGKGGYGKDTSGMHGAGAAVAKSCTKYFDVIARSGSAGGVYTVHYEDGERDDTKGDNGLVYIGPLSDEHPIKEYRDLGIKYTGTRVEYLYDDTVLSSTSKGIACEPYSQNVMIQRFKESLMGVEDRDSIKIIFVFQGEETIITPYDMTPEQAVGFDVNGNEDTCVCLEFGSGKEAEGTEAEYHARLYLNMDPYGYDFKDTVIVNRLKMQQSTSTETLEATLHKFIFDQIKEDVKAEGYVLPDKRVLSFSRFFKACTILSLPIAAFSSQQKDNLKSTMYLYSFREEIESVLVNNVHLFKPVIDAAVRKIIDYNEAKKREEDDKKKRAKELGNTLTIKAQINKAKQLKKSREEQVADKQKARKSRIKIKTSNVTDKSKVSLGFFEGDNASTVINPLIEANYPVASVTLSGKVCNIYDPRKDLANIESIERLIREVFIQPYREYLIFTDPDPDGAHIRMQVIALIAAYNPKMLQHEKVFVIRAPYGRIRVGAGKKVVITNEFEGTIELEEGVHYVNSYDEMRSALEQGAEYVCVFSGALDVMSNCSQDIPIQTMLTDPKYKVPIKAPTEAELAYLKEMLTPDSQVKKEFTYQFYTERKQITRGARNMTKRLKVKTGSNSLTSVAYTVTESPIVSGYKNLTYYSVLY